MAYRSLDIQSLVNQLESLSSEEKIKIKLQKLLEQIKAVQQKPRFDLIKGIDDILFIIQNLPENESDIISNYLVENHFDLLKKYIIEGGLSDGIEHKKPLQALRTLFFEKFNLKTPAEKITFFVDAVKDNVSDSYLFDEAMKTEGFIEELAKNEMCMQKIYIQAEQNNRSNQMEIIKKALPNIDMESKTASERLLNAIRLNNIGKVKSLISSDTIKNTLKTNPIFYSTILAQATTIQMFDNIFDTLSDIHDSTIQHYLNDPKPNLIFLENAIKTKKYDLASHIINKTTITKNQLDNVLLKAVHANKEDVVKTLTILFDKTNRLQPDANAISTTNLHTPLYYAVANNNLEIAKLLIQNGASTTPLESNIKQSITDMGFSLVEKAIAHNNPELVSLLLSHGRNAYHWSAYKLMLREAEKSPNSSQHIEIILDELAKKTEGLDSRAILTELFLKNMNQYEFMDKQDIEDKSLIKKIIQHYQKKEIPIPINPDMLNGFYKPYNKNLKRTIEKHNNKCLHNKLKSQVKHFFSQFSIKTKAPKIPEEARNTPKKATIASSKKQSPSLFPKNK